jgi:hypothetical protein
MLSTLLARLCNAIAEYREVVIPSITEGMVDGGNKIMKAMHAL